MYLVHLTISTPSDSPLPEEIKEMLEATAPNVLEHVSVHPQAQPHPVISLFLRVASLDEAEATAKHIWERAAAACTQLTDLFLLSAEVPLVPYDLE